MLRKLKQAAIQMGEERNVVSFYMYIWSFRGCQETTTSDKDRQTG